jgi:hypothetical protein
MTTFKIGFDGPSIENGEIDVTEFAPSLLALRDLLASANAALNNERSETTLSIKATEKGSFVALLSLDVSTITDLLDTTAANPLRVAAAKDIVEILLGVGQTIAVPTGFFVGSYFAALKFLGGKRPDEVVPNNDGTVSINLNAETIIVSPDTVKLLSDVTTREATKKFLKNTFASQGVQKVGFSEQGIPSREVHSLELTRRDIAAAVVPDPLPEETEKITQKRVSLLKIVSAQFEEGYLWRFTDGHNTFTASMDDQEFLRQIDTAEVQLSKNDTLKCLIEETQELTGSQLKTTVAILEVMRYLPGAHQMNLL